MHNTLSIRGRIKYDSIFLKNNIQEEFDKNFLEEEMKIY